jgi:Domain of unknown function (DUF4157)/Heterokaryon incompatibility protein Het-C
MHTHEPQSSNVQPQTAAPKVNPFAPRPFEVMYPGQERASSPTNPFPRRPHEVWMGEPRAGYTHPFSRRPHEVWMGESVISPKPNHPETQPEPEAHQPLFGGQPFRLNAPDAPTPMSRWGGIQAKLTVGAPNDVYEKEADRVAEQVMSMAPPGTSTVPRQTEAEEAEEIQTKPLAETSTPLVQRQEMLAEEEPIQAKCETCTAEEPIQRAADGVAQVQPDLENRLNASQGGGSALPDEVRSFMEPRFGADFSQVRVHTSSDAVQMNRDLNAQAFTHKQDVYFGAGKAPANDALTAHELTHVVQQSGIQHSSHKEIHQKTDGIPKKHSEKAVNESTQTENLSRKSAQSHSFLSTADQPIIQAFDPRFHRQSVVEGLDDTGFSAEEIGQIYAANWERDLSQVHPYLGNIILAWKGLKIAAIQNHLTQSEISSFEGTVEQLLNLALTPGGFDQIKKGKAYGGYNYYEHMDNPGNNELLQKPQGESIPQYMVDSREYMKANLFKATNAYRGDMATSKSGQVASDFAATAAQENRVKQQVKDGGGNVVPGEKLSTPVANETTEQAKRNPLTPSSTTSSGGQWKPEVADALGRTSHALEDFFAHSNFVELAIGQPAPVLTGIDIDKDTGKRSTSTKELGTGTFDKTDENHALSHKIRSLANEIDNEMPLVNRVAGKTSINPHPDQVHIGSTDGAREESGSTAAIVKAIATGVEATAIVAENIGEGATLGGPAGAYIGLHTGLRAAIRGTILTPRGTQMLRQIAEHLEESSRTKSEDGSHTKLAKDQGGHENTPFERLKEIKFKLARDLATAADKEIFGRMRQVFDAPSPESADLLLQGIYTSLNQLIAPPDGHPLSGVIDRRRDEATKALQEYMKQSQQGDFPTPNPDVKPV